MGDGKPRPEPLRGAAPQASPPPPSEESAPCGRWQWRREAWGRPASTAARSALPSPARATRLQPPQSAPALFLRTPPLPETASHWPGVRLGVVTSSGRLRRGSRPRPIGPGAPGRYRRHVTFLSSHPSRAQPQTLFHRRAHRPRTARLVPSAPSRVFCPNIQASLPFPSTLPRCQIGSSAPVTWHLLREPPHLARFRTPAPILGVASDGTIYRGQGPRSARLRLFKTNL